MKETVAYKSKEKWGVRNKMWFKKKLDNIWTSRKKNRDKVKKIGCLGYQKKIAV